MVNENLAPISQPVFTPERVKEAYRLIDASKRKSQHYTLKAGSMHEAGVYFGTSFIGGQRLKAKGNLINA